MMATEQKGTPSPLQRLIDVGIALSAERNVQKILDMVVEEAMELTRADGATLYLVTPDDAALRFEIVLNRTLSTDLRRHAKELRWPDVPLQKDGHPNLDNVSAYAAIIKQPVNIPDVYQVANFDFSGMRRYDRENNYACKSMLVVPLLDHEDTVTGVLQLINALPEGSGAPVPFTERQQEIVRALASQAAVALNNAHLIESLHALFDSLIRAIAAAIDAKSPYTGGHVRRVTEITVDLATAINQVQTGRFADVRFDEHEMKELRTAAWLHDFGKVTTPEVLVDKHTKLEKIVDRAELVALRFEAARLRAQLGTATGALRESRAALAEAIAGADLPECRAITADQEFVLQWNDGSRGPTDEQVRQIEQIARARGVLTEDEIKNLAIRRGTLNDQERKKIEEHVTITRRTLQELKFPKSMARVPVIAGGHHELLDGSGYPEGLKGDRIPLQTRILTVADIFEALTAERPYKKSMPVSQAVAIMEDMARKGKLDGDVLKVAVEEGVFTAYMEREAQRQKAVRTNG
jgi:HD-GYP domain-containing protein (c-di-GMP phosphodiesterase class II)